MAALKKTVMALMLVVLAMSSAGVANAQIPPLTLGVITCTAVAVPPVVRAEGIAELVGDIILSCTNTPPPNNNGPLQQYVVTNFSTSLNTNVTNNIDFGAGSNVTDAILVINENNSTTPTATPTAGPDPRFQGPQYGRLAAVNRLEWNEVSFPVPGAPSDITSIVACDSAPGACFPFVTTVRITNIRANAAQLGVPAQATFPSTQVQAFVSITGPNTIPVTNNVLNVAVPILGLLVKYPSGVVGLQCLDGSAHVEIELQEGFATSFKTLGVPTFLPGNTQWESGYFSPGSNNGGGASQATRFLIRFFNIPEGVDVFVDNYLDNGSIALTGDALAIQLVIGTNSNGAGGSLVGSTTGTTQVNISGGFGFAVYEVVDGNPFAVENIDVPVWFEWESDTANDIPAVGTGQASVSFAPISTVTTANAGEPEPRFVDTGGDPRNILSIVRCTTTLLFPFVTNQAGFDTGMAISNTSKDWLGTDPQSGACTVHYHGSTTGGGAAPPDQTSTVLAGGEQLIFTLSGGNPAQGIDGAPEFQGYIIVVCEFQYAHGFAFITDGFGGIPALAQGYLALVIPGFPSLELPRVPGAIHYDSDLNGFINDVFGERLSH